MAVYVISDVTMRDADAFEAYRTRAAPSIAAYGGRYLVRGGEVSVLEGERAPKTLVVVEFPDRATAERWYTSAEYGEALKFRDKGLSRSSCSSTAWTGSAIVGRNSDPPSLASQAMDGFRVRRSA